MKYASEVIDLLAAYPNRAFKMIQIVRHVADGHPESPKEWERVRKGVRRVLDSLEENLTTYGPAKAKVATLYPYI